MLKRLKGWRTWLVNAALAVLPIVELAEFRDILPDNYVKWYALGVVLVNMWLRKMTTTPLGRSE